MGVSKVEFGGDTLIDLTDDSVTPETMMKGTTAHNSAGEPIEGTFDPDIYQTKTDESLETDDKSVVGAINELNEKINASSGDDSTVGTWVFNDEIDFLSLPSRTELSFMSNDTSYSSIQKREIADVATGMSYSARMVYIYASYTDEYTTGWRDEAYKNVTFTDPITDATFLAWLKANAKKKQPVGVDKIETIDTWWGDTYEAEDTGEGITWSDTFALLDKDGNEISAGAIHQKVPIKAGDNIRFEALPDGIIIHATGGGSGGGSSTPSVSLIGTWTVIDNPEIPTSDISLEFTSNGTEYIGIVSTSMGSSSWGINALSYKIPEGYYEAAYVNNPSGSYGIDHGWKNEAYRYLTVIKEPDDPEAIAWLGNNTDAPKVKLEKEQMPQIRFANFQDTAGSMLLREDNPFTFTVEVLGGGELKEGDLLQICVRRKYWYKTLTGGFKHKWKLRSVVQREITDEDFGKRFLSINVTLGDVEPRGNWLFRNDRNPLNSDGTIDTHSYMYFRIKRVTQYGSDGEECNAIFSNVEKVAKTYAPHSKHLTIK